MSLEVLPLGNAISYFRKARLPIYVEVADLVVKVVKSDLLDQMTEKLWSEEDPAGLNDIHFTEFSGDKIIILL